jgi:hypothetical protein
MGMNGWHEAKSLMQRYASSVSFNLPSTKVTGLGDPYDDSIITLSFANSNPRYKSAYDKLHLESSYTGAAKSLIIKQAQTDTGPDGGSFGYFTILGEKDMRKVHQKQIQYSNVPKLNQVNRHDAALNGFNYYAIVAGCARKENGIVRAVFLTHYGIYLRDSWDFQGPQYLGSWNFSTHAVRLLTPTRILGFTIVTNGDFRDWQKRTGMGGEFWIFSEKEKHLFKNGPLMLTNY